MSCIHFSEPTTGDVPCSFLHFCFCGWFLAVPASCVRGARVSGRVRAVAPPAGFVLRAACLAALAGWRLYFEFVLFICVVFVVLASLVFIGPFISIAKANRHCPVLVRDTPPRARESESRKMHMPPRKKTHEYIPKAEIHEFPEETFGLSGRLLGPATLRSLPGRTRGF